MPDLASRSAVEATVATTPPRAAPRGRVFKRLRVDPVFWFGTAIMIVLFAMAIAPGLFTAMSPGGSETTACSIRDGSGAFQDRQTPSATHWFGTDLEGCDYFARVIEGARPSLGVGLVAVTVATVIAVGLVMIGDLGGRAGDGAVTAIADVWFGIPGVIGAILLLSLVSSADRGVFLVGLVIGILSWPLPLRIFRASVQRTSTRGFVESTRAMGASRLRIVSRHVFPNSVSPLIVYTAVSFGLLIAAEATLTFLGVGLDAQTVSWGRMIAEAETRVSTNPHLVLFPGLMLTLVLLGSVLLADALRDALDPRGADR